MAETPDNPLKGMEELLPILVFLLPGFVSSGIVDLLVVRKPKEPFGKCLEGLIFTAINLACFTVLRALAELVPGVLFSRVGYFTFGNVVLMTLCAVAIGVLWSHEANNEWFFEWLRKRHLTRKTHKVSTWSEAFVDNPKFVVVHLQGQRRAFGWPRFYSDSPEERAIFLEKASWLNEDGSRVNPDPISIFLDKESKIEFIEFIPADNEPIQTDPPPT